MTTEQLTKKYGILIRISTEKTTQGKKISAEETLKNHKEILISYCERNNFDYEIFAEIVSGGTEDLEDRTALNDLLKNLHKFDGILVTELSRLSRDSVIAGLIKRAVTKFGKLIVTPEACYDLRNASDALMYDVGNAVAVHERTVIGKRIKNNKISIAKQGLNASGSVPIGYIRNPQTKKLEIDPITCHIPSTAFYLSTKGYGAAKIQKYFNECGYKTQRGKFFSITSIKDILQNETYKGNTIYNDIEKVMVEDPLGEMIQKKRIKDTIRVENTHPAMVDPEIFDAIQSGRSRRGEKHKGNREKPSKNPSIIKDLLYCECCKRKKIITFDVKNGHMIRNCYYILPDGSYCECTGFKAAAIENKVLEQIFKHQEKIEAEIKMLQSNDHQQLSIEKEDIKNMLEKEIQQLDLEAEQLAHAMIALVGKSNSEVIQKVLDEKMMINEQAKKSAAQQLEKIQSDLNKPKIEEEIQKRLNYIFAIEKIQKETDSEKINNLLKQFINKIHYKRILPAEISKLGIRDPKRKNFAAEIEIEYI